AIEGFDVAVLHRPTWGDVMPLDNLILRPAEDGVRGKFGAVVGHDHPRFASRADQRKFSGRSEVQSSRNSKRGRRDAVQCACLVIISNSRFYNGPRQLLDKKRDAIRALNDLLDNLLG